MRTVAGRRPDASGSHQLLRDGFSVGANVFFCRAQQHNDRAAWPHVPVNPCGCKHAKIKPESAHINLPSLYITEQNRNKANCTLGALGWPLFKQGLQSSCDSRRFWRTRVSPSLFCRVNESPEFVKRGLEHEDRSTAA